MDATVKYLKIQDTPNFVMYNEKLAILYIESVVENAFVG